MRSCSRVAGLSSSFAINARCGNGPWLIRATPARRPVRLGRSAGEGDDVERQRNLPDDPLDLAGIGQAGDEEAARSGVRERLPALDHLIDQRVVIGLRLEEEIGPGVDEESVADRRSDRRDPLGLPFQR